MRGVYRNFATPISPLYLFGARDWQSRKRPMLTNYWYIACQSASIRRRPLAVQILSCNLVLFRTEDGSPAALENRCAHRGMPLAAGRSSGDSLQCAYHGWCYDKSGTAMINALHGVYRNLRRPFHLCTYLVRVIGSPEKDQC